jgi:protoporphyrinogen/coproporphyrinogen III oxidase
MSQIDQAERRQEARSAVCSPHHAPHVVIIGGGIAGLATAYTLQERTRAAQRPLTCTLVEARERLGGVILTERVDGFIIEAGPDSLLTQKPWGVELCQQLGIGDHLIGTNDQQRKIYILWHGRLQPLPEGLMLIVPTRLGPLLRSRLLTWPGKIRMACEYFLPPRPPEGDESLAAFVRRRLGREALEKIAAPLLAGIYAGSLEQMSLLATFPRLRELEAQYGGLMRGVLAQRRALAQVAPAHGRRSPAMFMAPRAGMAEIVEAINSRLDQVTMMRGTSVQRIVPRGEGVAGLPSYEVQLDRAPALQAEAVVMATPAHVTARVVEGFHSKLAQALRAIPYASTATISLAYRRADVPHPLDGFGFLVGHQEGRRLMAATWTSSKFAQRAPAEHVLIRSFIGGAGRERLVSLEDAALIQLVREELGEILGILQAPLLARVFRWERANPQYRVGHLQHVEGMEKMLASFPGLFLTGSAYRGVGVPDCIYQGTQTAERVLVSLTTAV